MCVRRKFSRSKNRIKIEEKLKKRHKKVNNKWKRKRYQKAQVLKL